jgi:ferredoxin
VLAGQDVDLSLLQNLDGLVLQDGVVQVDSAKMMTGHPGVFAGGDMVPAERNVTVAVGTGKKPPAISTPGCAAAVYTPPPNMPATAERLNTWYYSDAPNTVRPQLDLARRTSSFDEVQGGFDRRHGALFEARRCLSCGNCFECDNCYGVCPDNAVTKLGPGKGFEFNTTTAKDAACAWPNAPVAPSTWCRKRFNARRLAVKGGIQVYV